MFYQPTKFYQNKLEEITVPMGCVVLSILYLNRCYNLGGSYSEAARGKRLILSHLPWITRINSPMNLSGVSLFLSHTPNTFSQDLLPSPSVKFMTYVLDPPNSRFIRAATIICRENVSSYSILFATFALSTVLFFSPLLI